MFVWMGPRWLARRMRPGSRGSRIAWWMSVPVAVVIIAVAWTSFTHDHAAGSAIGFLVLWTAGVIAIEAVNFRSMYLGLGRRAEAMKRAADDAEAR